jgi:hypothetical protein
MSSSERLKNLYSDKKSVCKSDFKPCVWWYVMNNEGEKSSVLEEIINELLTKILNEMEPMLFNALMDNLRSGKCDVCYEIETM